MSFLTDIGNSLVSAYTGSTPAELQAKANAVESNLTIAISTMIGLQAIIAFELLILVAMSWKDRH